MAKGHQCYRCNQPNSLTMLLRSPWHRQKKVSTNAQAGQQAVTWPITCACTLKSQQVILRPKLIIDPPTRRRAIRKKNDLRCIHSHMSETLRTSRKTFVEIVKRQISALIASHFQAKDGKPFHLQLLPTFTNQDQPLAISKLPTVIIPFMYLSTHYHPF